MWQTSTRLLRLLAMLQARRDWSGQDLASRLEVSTRTIRTDIERLRELGYPVEATPGVGGGYRLGHGTTMPPLLLDDEEAVAVAVALRTTAGAGVTGIEEASLRTLVKLEQLLPSRLRHRIDAMRAATVSVPGAGPTVDSAVLSAIAGAIRASERLRFDYVDHNDRETRRITEPQRLVVWGRRWYLLAWDVDRADWRTFRVDRIKPKIPTGPRFKPRPLTDEDAASYVQRSAGSATWRYRARIRIHAPLDQVRPLLPLAVDVSSDGPDRCIIQAGSDTPHQLALYIGLLDTDFEILEPSDLAEAFVRLAERYHRAAQASMH
ncbi:MAG TPA: YafY family protein [Propionibacteriaceae bacterium]|jgi:predicted DNA-binding transcriptional regulator YafY|nr:YafY family protein [Propionibacteriaceae bacterium]